MYRRGRYKNKKRKNSSNNQTNEVHRVKVPGDNEVLGAVLSLLGSGRMLVMCTDDKERVCRIPGRIRKKMWIKEGDIVLVQPWSIEGDKKGDIVWRYSNIDADWLRRKGYIKRSE